MKAFLASVLGVVILMAAASGQSLQPGSEVSLEAVRKADWIQGDAPDAFEPGKVYVFECWATWCGPCVAAIPHLNELHKKYHSKGLRVHGMNVWEDQKQTVKSFVKNKGKGMSYPVAFTGGKSSAFDKEWLAPAGIRGIPTAFVVINGKLVTNLHPSGLTDEQIEEWLKQAAKSAPVPAPAKRSQADVIKDYQIALVAGNAVRMEELIKELAALDPKHKDLPSMQLDLLVAKEDWSSAAVAIEVLSDTPGGVGILQKLTHKVVMEANRTYPPEWLKMLAAAHLSSRGAENLTAMDHVGVSMLFWRAGDRVKSLDHAKRAAVVGKLEGEKEGNPEIGACFAKFASSVESGVMPGMKEVHASLPKKSE